MGWFVATTMDVDIVFTWDPEKAERNLQVRGISFDVAVEVFAAVFGNEGELLRRGSGRTALWRDWNDERSRSATGRVRRPERTGYRNPAYRLGAKGREI